MEKREIIDLYVVGTGSTRCEPFVYWLAMQGPKGEKVRTKGVFDGGAMVAAMDKEFWERHKGRLGGGRPSRKTLWMASGQLVDLEATWEGEIELEGVCAHGSFEVFDSSGGWTFLFGKPLQAIFGAVHDYKRDVVNIEANRKRATLENQQGEPWWRKYKPASDANAHAAFTGVLSGFDEHHHLETIAEDREGEDREELAETTRIEEVRTREEQKRGNALETYPEGADQYRDQTKARTNSPGARATPVRGVFERANQLQRREANKDTLESFEDGEMSMWWARAEEKGDEERKGPDIPQSEDKGEARTETREAKGRPVTVEEVEDEGDNPSELRVEVHMQPEKAWTQTCANSTGDSASPVRGVLNRITAEERTPTDSGVPEAREEESETATEEEKSPKHKRAISVGASAAPARGVDPSSHGDSASINPKAEVAAIDPNQRSAREDNGTGTEEVGMTRGDSTVALEHAISVGVGATPPRGVQADELVLFTEGIADDASNLAEHESDMYDTEAYTPEPAAQIFTRANDPFNTKRIEHIIESVEIGPDLTAEHEVFPVAGAVYAPKIPAEKKFSTRVQQRPLSRPQAEYLHEQVEVLERAGVIRPIHPRDVKCVSPIKLAEKEHEGGGLTHEELKHELNEECIRAGLPPVYNLPPRDAEPKQNPPTKPQKWRICQNFHELNELLKVVPFPQGDIRDKQRRLSGHRYISIFDFAD
ncbi:hypothetical protein B0H14DRAFT_3478661 [Mycena olivaceomarginata]|nr:hypothetical protein B0H14DRAFT_3478661 [Mycena olivaceomarginata]